jgi:replication fork clamp-binding protein CrfC
MTMNVTLEGILQAHTARKRALEEYEQAEEFRINQTFSTIRNELNPKSYDRFLADTMRRSSVKSGEWLYLNTNFIRWLDANDRAHRLIWLHGIPGAGKSSLVVPLPSSVSDVSESR